MIIQLDENARVQDVEEEFSFFFPYLKLELEPLGGLEEVRRSRSVEIKSSMTVAELRRVFSDDLQIFVKLSRKKNEGWTAVADEPLTLKEANEAGQADSESVHETGYEDFFETEY